MNPNVLRRYMQDFDRMGMGASINADAGDGRMVPVRGAQDFNNVARMMYAERMAQPQDQGPPDFFGERPFNALAQYREPQGFQAPPALPERQQMPQRMQRTNVLRSMRSY